jgi:hypothetical protein
MNNKIITRLVFCSVIFIFGCTKDYTISLDLSQNELAVASVKTEGATQVSGIGYYSVTGECEPMIDGAAYAIKMTGDLEGCIYVFIDNYGCSPSGTYREEGREYFVGTFKGKAGTFRTTYKFEAKYEGCAANGAPLGAEIFGRCQHPLVKESGTDGFKGVTGQINFTDNVVVGNFPYRGYLRF